MLKKIRLELARDHDHPEGSNRIGYEFGAPLDAAGRIDADEWHRLRDHCRVRRFRPGEEDDIGHLVRKPGGSWAFLTISTRTRKMTRAVTASLITSSSLASTCRSVRTMACGPSV